MENILKIKNLQKFSGWKEKLMELTLVVSLIISSIFRNLLSLGLIRLFIIPIGIILILEIKAISTIFVKTNTLEEE